MLLLAACSNSDPIKRPTTPPPVNNTVINFSTYLGNDLADVVRDLVLDAAGNSYVVGGANSVNLLPGTPVRAHGGGEDAFVAKFDVNGQVVWWTFLGGPGPDRGYAIDLAANDEVVIGGGAANNFPVTAGAVLTQFQSGKDSASDPARDGFVARLDANGALLWATYFGGGAEVGETSDKWDDPSSSVVRDVAVDPVSQNIYLVAPILSPATPPIPSGQTTAPPLPDNLPTVILTALQSGDFATRPGYQNSLVFDGLLAKLTPDGASLPWATYVGGSGNEALAATVRVDSQGNPIVLWVTESTQRTLPVATPTFEPIAEGTVHDTTFNGATDFYIAKFALNGPLVWATFVGGGGFESADGSNLVLQQGDSIVLAASTTSPNFNPIGSDPFDPTYNGSGNSGYFSADCGIAKLAPDATTLLATTFYGGGTGDACSGIALDAQDRIYVTGGTHSPDLPIASGPHQSERPGPRSAFLAVFTPDLTALLNGGYFGGSGLGNSNALAVRSSTATSGRIVFAGESEAAYPLTPSPGTPARGTVTAPPAHGVLSDVTLQLP